MRQKNNIPAYAGHFLSTEIDSTDFKNENSTTKTRQKNHIFLKRIFEKILKKTRPSTKIKNKYLKKYQTKKKNKKKQLKTAGYLDTKDQDKIKSFIRLYLQKTRQKKQYSCKCWAFFKKTN